jgi:hypothetical protein
MALPVAEEGKLLSEALNTVKIQVQQMKRHLVCPQQIGFYSSQLGILMRLFNAGIGSTYGRFEECESNAG